LKARLLRGIAAGVIGLAVVMPVTALPAHATDPNDAYVDITIDVLASLFDKLPGGLSASETVDLVRETINAINGVKVDVVSRLDAQIVNELRGKVQFAVTSVHYLNHPSFTGLYTIQINTAAHQAKAHIDTVSSDRDLDAVGRAMMTLFALLEVGEAKQGLLNPSVRFADYRAGLENLINKMAPHCSQGAVPQTSYYWKECTFNGRTTHVAQRHGLHGNEISVDGGPWVPGVLGNVNAAEMVMSTTAEKLAKDVLEQLRQRGY
jgi:hypothetical protein